MYELWISASQAFKSEVQRRLNGNYTSPPPPGITRPWPPNDNPLTFDLLYTMSEETYALFHEILDSDVLQNFLESWDAAGRTYRVWSLYAPRPERVPPVRADFDTWIAAYPKDFAVMGAWRWDGQQVGNPPWYPIPDELINFMPRGVLEDVHLLVGQSPRDFTQ